jgi:hypothetical protein
MAVIQFVSRLVTGHAQLIDIYHHDIITAIDVRGEFRLVFAAQPMRERSGEPAQHLVLGVDQIPGVRSLMGFRHKRFHNQIRKSIQKRKKALDFMVKIGNLSNLMNQARRLSGEAPFAISSHVSPK